MSPKSKLEVEFIITAPIWAFIIDLSFAQRPNGLEYFEPIDYSVISRSDHPRSAPEVWGRVWHLCFALGDDSENTGGEIPTGWPDSNQGDGNHGSEVQSR